MFIYIYIYICMNRNRWVVYTSLTTCPWTKMKTKILKIEIILKNLQISISRQNNALSFITRDTIFSRTENSEAAKCFTILNPTSHQALCAWPHSHPVSSVLLKWSYWSFILCVFVYHKYRIIKIFKRTVKLSADWAFSWPQCHLFNQRCYLQRARCLTRLYN